MHTGVFCRATEQQRAELHDLGGTAVEHRGTPWRKADIARRTHRVITICNETLVPEAWWPVSGGPNRGCLMSSTVLAVCAFGKHGPACARAARSAAPCAHSTVIGTVIACTFRGHEYAGPHM